MPSLEEEEVLDFLKEELDEARQNFAANPRNQLAAAALRATEYALAAKISEEKTDAISRRRSFVWRIWEFFTHKERKKQMSESLASIKKEDMEGRAAAAAASAKAGPEGSPELEYERGQYLKFLELHIKNPEQKEFQKVLKKSKKIYIRAYKKLEVKKAKAKLGFWGKILFTITFKSRDIKIDAEWDIKVAIRKSDEIVKKYILKKDWRNALARYINDPNKDNKSKLEKARKTYIDHYRDMHPHQNGYSLADAMQKIETRQQKAFAKAVKLSSQGPLDIEMREIYRPEQTRDARARARATAAAAAARAETSAPVGARVNLEFDVASWRRQGVETVSDPKTDTKTGELYCNLGNNGVKLSRRLTSRDRVQTYVTLPTGPHEQVEAAASDLTDFLNKNGGYMITTEEGYTALPQEYKTSLQGRIRTVSAEKMQKLQRQPLRDRRASAEATRGPQPPRPTRAG